jgi:hypothetical protein
MLRVSAKSHHWQAAGWGSSALAPDCPKTGAHQLLQTLAVADSTLASQWHDSLLSASTCSVRLPPIAAMQRRRSPFTCLTNTVLRCLAPGPQAWRTSGPAPRNWGRPRHLGPTEPSKSRSHLLRTEIPLTRHPTAAAVAIASLWVLDLELLTRLGPGPEAAAAP